MDAGGGKNYQKGRLGRSAYQINVPIYLWISCTKIRKMGWFKDGSSRSEPRRSSYGGVCVPGEWREVGR